MIPGDSVNGLSLLATFGLYTITKGPYSLDYTGLFTALSLISIMVGPFLNLVQMLPDLYEGYVSWKRIADFVASSGLPDTNDPSIEIRGQLRAANHSLIAFARDSSIGWTTEPTLSGLTFDLERGSVIVVTGDTGSGKSTLLKSLVGEVSVLAGSVKVFTSRVAYCDQNPFFLPGLTFRDQVVWGNDFDQMLYLSVLKACQLDTDICGLPDGESQIIFTTDGVPLSGGQRKRLALARALYHNPELLILDDVFTGIDPETAARMGDALFGNDGFLQTRLPQTAVILSSPSGMPFHTDMLMIRSTNANQRISKF